MDWFNEYHAKLTKRKVTFREFFNLLLNSWPTDGGVIVETGTLRGLGSNNWDGEGCSTFLFSEFVKYHGGTVWSVDNDPRVIDFCRAALEPNGQVNLVLDDSVGFLREFGSVIDGLYLDSANDADLTLQEIEIAYDNLHAKSVVMIDDCVLPGQKGAKSIPFLLSRGWKEVSPGYQRILVRKDG